MADALRLDFALIHKDRARAGPQGHNRPYSGMPKMNGTVRLSEEDEESVVNGEGSTASDDLMMASISSLNEAGVNGDVMNTAVSVVANHEGEESTITLVGDVKNKPVFLTVSSAAWFSKMEQVVIRVYCRMIWLTTAELSWMPPSISSRNAAQRRCTSLLHTVY